jgi:hypothetical protein
VIFLEEKAIEGPTRAQLGTGLLTDRIDNFFTLSQLVHDTVEVGTATLAELDRQGEQVDKVEADVTKVGRIAGRCKATSWHVGLDQS